MGLKNSRGSLSEAVYADHMAHVASHDSPPIATILDQAFHMHCFRSVNDDVA